MPPIPANPAPEKDGITNLGNRPDAKSLRPPTTESSGARHDVIYFNPAVFTFREN
jgi:hypothetical protein